MDDDAYARSADTMQQRLQQSSDKDAELARIFADAEILFGLYPDPESITRWDKFVMKGAKRLTDESSVSVACLWCRSIEEAMTMARRYGDDRQQTK